VPSPLPPASEPWRKAITARITAVNDMLDLAVADVTLEQVNHVERKGVLPIAFSLIHVVGGQDRSVSQFITKTPLLWESGDWKKKVGLARDVPGRGTPMADAEKIRFGSLDAWREYQRAVFAKTENALENAPLEVFDRDAFDGKRPDPGEKPSFLFILVPSGTIRVREVVEAYLFQHAARHLGEIEHARALVGLGGLS
jgi:hypothetical protein